MNLLSVLIIVQVSGIVLSGFSVMFHSKLIRRQMRYNRLYAHHSETTEDEWPWLIEYFQNYPKSDLKSIFPHFYKTAMATKRYKELIGLKRSGALSSKQFKKKIKKLLPFLNIRQDRLNQDLL